MSRVPSSTADPAGYCLLAADRADLARRVLRCLADRGPADARCGWAGSGDVPLGRGSRWALLYRVRGGWAADCPGSPGGRCAREAMRHVLGW